jgi:hypothetical protein
MIVTEPTTTTTTDATDRNQTPSEHAATFRQGVYLTKREVFEACQALADADRVLVAVGTTDESGALGDLFELLEDRMTRP